MSNLRSFIVLFTLINKCSIFKRDLVGFLRNIGLFLMSC
jgi:hypothetical protein